jgi:predicted nucleic acid-binding protein
MQSSLAATTPPTDLHTVYVDTNIFHYLAIGPPKEQGLKGPLAELIKAAENDLIVCVTSIIALAEEYDIHKGRAFVRREMDRGNINWTHYGVAVRSSGAAEPLDPKARRRAVRIVSQGLRTSFVRLQDPPAWPTDLIDLLCRSSNFHWPDALHLAIALAMRCDYLLTNDKQFYDEIVQGLTTESGPLHRPVAWTLASVYGLPQERLQPPLIQPLLLRDSATSTVIASLAGPPDSPVS